MPSYRRPMLLLDTVLKSSTYSEALNRLELQIGKRMTERFDIQSIVKFEKTVSAMEPCCEVLRDQIDARGRNLRYT
jgi:hypothetical protein